MPKDRTHTSISHDTGKEQERHSGFGMGLGKCCRCRQTVQPGGWCDNCAIWPKNMVPSRYCRECNSRIGPAGECQNCGDFTGTRLELEGDQWRDTGKIGKRMGFERCKALMREIDCIAMASMTKAQPKKRDLEAEKRAIQDLGGDDVPF